MKLKSKLFGFGAASLLALGMTTGVMAAEEASTTVALTDGACTVTMGDTDVDYGEWEFDGTQYHGESDGTVELVISNQQHTSKSCFLQVKATHLNGGGGKKISAENLGLYSPSGYFTGTWLSTNYQTLRQIPSAVGSTDEIAELKLNVPAETAPGTYTGTIFFQTSNTQ